MFEPIRWYEVRFFFFGAFHTSKIHSALLIFIRTKMSLKLAYMKSSNFFCLWSGVCHASLSKINKIIWEGRAYVIPRDHLWALPKIRYSLRFAQLSTAGCFSDLDKTIVQQSIFTVFWGKLLHFVVIYFQVSPWR